ncbi:hypothetical protein PCE1_002469 [Barthelona sp. PCE]
MNTTGLKEEENVGSDPIVSDVAILMPSKTWKQKHKRSHYFVNHPLPKSHTWLQLPDTSSMPKDPKWDYDSTRRLFDLAAEYNMDWSIIYDRMTLFGRNFTVPELKKRFYETIKGMDLNERASPFLKKVQCTKFDYELEDLNDRFMDTFTRRKGGFKALPFHNSRSLQMSDEEMVDFLRDSQKLRIKLKKENKMDNFGSALKALQYYQKNLDIEKKNQETSEEIPATPNAPAMQQRDDKIDLNTPQPLNLNALLTEKKKKRDMKVYSNFTTLESFFVPKRVKKKERVLKALAEYNINHYHIPAYTKEICTQLRRIFDLIAEKGRKESRKK